MPSRTDAEFSIVKGGVGDGLNEIRAISAGLRLPSLAPLKVSEVAERAHQRRSSTPVELYLDNLPAQVPLSVKITLFRALVGGSEKRT